MTSLQSPPAARSKSRFRWVAAVLLVAAVIGGGIGAAIAVSQAPPGGNPNSLPNFMGLSALPAKPAPGFSLVDQAGKPVSLSQFRGKSVVLTFMDPKCTDICPLVADEFLKAQADLGAKAKGVVFLAVDANPLATSVADVKAFTTEHGLGGLHNWYFATASSATLQKIWNHYGVLVQVDTKTGTVLHGNQIYFIGPGGHERYLASPADYYIKNGTAFLPAPQLARWGRGIARYAGKLAT